MTTTDERDYGSLTLTYGSDENDRPTVSVGPDQLPEYILVQEDYWQAMHSPNAPWCWISDTQRAVPRPTEELDHSTTLDSDETHWAHIDATNIYARYEVLGRHESGAVAMRLDTWTKKA